MGETLFSFDRGDFHECQGRYRGERGQEYYRGDCWIENGSRVEVRSERKPVGPVSIIRQRSATNMYFRRTRRHIREDATDLSVLWFVKYGRITVCDQFGSRTVSPGEFTVTRSTSPFLLECRVDDQSVHEVFHVTVPTHILRSYAPCDTTNPLVQRSKRAELVIAENILADVFEDDDALSENAQRLLVDTALTLIGTVIREEEVISSRPTITERRQSDVLRFIEVNLSNPNLSLKMVASACGISPRYLSWLMRDTGTSFGRLVWGQRLEKARQSLANPELKTLTISEICYNLGFKSSAHFSRMFKRAFGACPNDFRNECRKGARLKDFGEENFPSATIQ